MGNYHVLFWRAVEEVTPSLTLIIREEALRIVSVGRTDTAHGRLRLASVSKVD